MGPTGELHAVWMLVALSPILLEVLVLFTRPTWLTFLPLWKVAERRVVLVRPRLDEQAADYRGAARAAPPLPAFEPSVDLGDAVLVSDGAKLALRRPFELARRNAWLIRIDVRREGDAVVLAARQVFVPMTLVVAGPLMGLQIGHDVVVALGFTVLLAVVYGLQLVFTAGQRLVACEHAFDELEQQLRAALEMR